MPLTGWGMCIDLFENNSENSLKQDLSNDTTLSPPLFSLVNTCKELDRLLDQLREDVRVLPSDSTALPSFTLR
jgi:hypothetical protein